MSKTIVCLWGGPGTGKTTTCAGVFNLLKKQDFDCEMNNEFVKDWVWEGREIKEGDQAYIFQQQARKERLYMNNQLDYIITDSPMALSIFYGDRHDKYEAEFGACRVMLKQHHKFCQDNEYKIEHIFLKRTKGFNPHGRIHTEEESLSADIGMKELLIQLGIDYTEFICDETVEQRIVEYLLEKR